MVMPRAVAGEGDGNLQVNSRAALAFEVIANVECEPVVTHWRIGRKIPAAAIGVCDAGSNFNPATRSVTHALSRFAIYRRNALHFEPTPTFEFLEVHRNSRCRF